MCLTLCRLAQITIEVGSDVEDVESIRSYEDSFRVVSGWAFRNDERPNEPEQEKKKDILKEE